jgi:hypothetical protein
MAATNTEHSSAALERALTRVLTEIREGLRHGFCEYTLTCEIIGRGRRRLQLRAGKNYQFVIPAEECESAGTSSDLRGEGVMESPS